MTPFPAGAAVENGIEQIADRLMGVFGDEAVNVARRWAERDDLRYGQVVPVIQRKQGKRRESS